MTPLPAATPRAAAGPRSALPSWCRLASSLALAAGLGGCATPAPEPGPGWTSGRLLLRVAATAERAAQGMSAAFELRGSGRQGELRLLSPLGTRMAQAQWAPGLAVLTGPQGEQRFDSLDALSQQALGEALPLAALPDWLAGRSWPGAPSTALPGGFAQLGWHIDLTRQAEGWIEARRSTPPAVQLRVRLAASAP